MKNGKFLELKCSRCKNVQTTFGKASTWIKCNECNKLLLKPKGGKAKVVTKVQKVL